MVLDVPELRTTEVVTTDSLGTMIDFITVSRKCIVLSEYQTLITISLVGLSGLSLSLGDLFLC